MINVWKYLNTRHKGIGEDDVLEALKRTHRRLIARRDGKSRAPKWNFSDWTTCTCGHIYAGAVGRKGTEDQVLASRLHPLYEEALKAVVKGNKLADKLEDGSLLFPLGLTSLVSNATMGVGEGRLDKAIELVENAITSLEAEYEKARKELVAQAVTQKLPEKGKASRVPSPARKEGPVRTEGRTEATV